MPLGEALQYCAVFPNIWDERYLRQPLSRDQLGWTKDCGQRRN